MALITVYRIWPLNLMGIQPHPRFQVNHYLVAPSNNLPLNTANLTNLKPLMKKLFVTLALSVLAVGAVQAAAFFVPIGPATINLTTTTNAPFQQSGKTNQTATSTNVTQFYKSAVIKTPFGTSDMLALLANSFNTNFPAGSQIDLGPGGLFVVDSSGTNIIFSPNPTIFFQSDVTFFPSTETLITAEKASGTTQSGNLESALIASLTLNYDDTLNTTADGTHTKFVFRGLYTVSKTENLKTGFVKATSQLQGTGGGTVRNVQTLLMGTISGKSSGTQPGF
jgi:hypothetical protein